MKRQDREALDEEADLIWQKQLDGVQEDSTLSSMQAAADKEWRQVSLPVASL